MKKWYWAALCVISVMSVQARLGETLEQCEARYGKSIGTSDKSGRCRFQKGPYYLEVHFSGNVVDALAVQRCFNGAPVDMSADEIKFILKANRPAARWYEGDTSGSNQDWRLQKNERSLFYIWNVQGGGTTASYDSREHAKLLLISVRTDFPAPPELGQL